MRIAYVHWVFDGELPVYDHRGTFSVAVETDGTWSWEQRTSRLLIPLYETTETSFCAFLDGPLPDGQGVMVRIQSTYELEGRSYLYVGAAVTDKPVTGVKLDPDLSLSDVVQAVIAFSRASDRPVDPRLGVLLREYEVGQRWQELQVAARGLSEPPDEAWFAANWNFPPNPKRTLAVAVDAWRHHQEDQARRAAWDQAQQRALTLLLGCLNEEQRAEFEQHKQFRVKASDGYTYLVTYKSHSGVWRLDGTRFLANCCLVPRDNPRWLGEDKIPIYDLMLAQKLMLESDLEGFLKTAYVKEILPELVPEALTPGGPPGVE